MYDVIISGVTGFVGANYMRYFSKLGYKVLGLSRTNKPPKDLLNYGDYLSVDLLKEIPSLNGKVLIHCAGLASDKLSLEDLLKSNYQGTKRIFEAASIEHFIQISSASVYPPSSKKHTEDGAVDIDSLSNYGLSKRKADEFLENQIGKGTKITILRPRAIYGIGDRVLLPRILQLEKLNVLLFPGNLHYEISLTNINNLLNITKLAMDDNKYNFEIFNVCDNFTYRLDKIITLLIQRVLNKRTIKITISESVISQLGRLFPNSNLNPTVLNYFLCDHQISNTKAIQYFDIDFQFNFYNYLSELVSWVEFVGKKNVTKGDLLLPWKY